MKDTDVMQNDNEAAKPGDGLIKRHAVLGLLAALVVFASDQGIKQWVAATMPFGQAVEVLPFFALYYTFNTGIAFSLLNDLNATTLLAIAAGIVLVLLVMWWQARRDGLVAALGFGLILGGAIGNIVDRAYHGHVIDYVLLHAGNYSFAIFNLADAALTVGVGFILLSGFLGKK